MVRSARWAGMGESRTGGATGNSGERGAVVRGVSWGRGGFSPTCVGTLARTLVKHSWVIPDRPCTLAKRDVDNKSTAARLAWSFDEVYQPADAAASFAAAWWGGGLEMGSARARGGVENAGFGQAGKARGPQRAAAAS